jgi:hypothetical protein
MTKPQSRSTIILLPPGGADQSAASPLGRVIACGPDVCPDIEPGQYVLATNQMGPELFRDIVTDNSWRIFDHTDIKALIYLEDN